MCSLRTYVSVMAPYPTLVCFLNAAPFLFFSLLEIVRTEKTSSQAIVDLLNFGRKIRKILVSTLTWRSLSLSLKALSILSSKHSSVLMFCISSPCHQYKMEIITSFRIQVKRLADEEILEMILFPVVNETCHIISEGIADKPSDLDVASVMGMGFPAYRGGVIFWSDIIGSKHICARLDDWSRKYGNFYRPSAYLMEQASKQGSLVRNLYCLSLLN